MGRSTSVQDLAAERQEAPILQRQYSDNIHFQVRAGPEKALRACFLRNLNQFFGGITLAVSKKTYKQFQILLEEITEIMKSHVVLKSAITSIYRINGMPLLSLDDFYEGDIVVCCCQYEPFVDIGYNVNKNYMSVLGTLIRIRNKLSAIENGNKNVGEFGKVIDFDLSQLPKSIRLYIDVHKAIQKNESMVIFSGSGRAQKDKKYTIKMAVVKNMSPRTSRNYLEAEILRQLQDHENIVDLIYTVERNKSIYIVIERLNFNLCELHQKLTVFSENLIRKIMKDTTNGLSYIHTYQIIHRDLKLQSLLVQLDSSGELGPSVGAIKISDFDKATYYKGQELYQCCGSLHYMAPEMINFEGYNFSADLWSLGVLLYFMLCNVLPFGFRQTDPDQIEYCIRKKYHRIPQAYRGKINPQAVQLLDSLLSKSPKGRPSAEKVTHHQFLLDYKEQFFYI